MQTAVTGIAGVVGVLALQIVTLFKVQSDQKCECTHNTIEFVTRYEDKEVLPNFTSLLYDVCNVELPLSSNRAAVLGFGFGCMLLGGLVACVILSYSGSTRRASLASARGRRPSISGSTDVVSRAGSTGVHQVPRRGTLSRAPTLGEGSWD